MTEQLSEIDIISAALTGDKRAVLQHQLKEISREILEYIVLELAQRHDIHEEILGLRNQALQLTPPEHERDDPVMRKDRLKIEAAILADQREERQLALKVKDTTKDLRREEREKQGALMEIDLREKRLKDLA